MPTDQINEEGSSSYNPGLSRETNQIIDEGSSSHNPGQEREDDDYADLVEALRRGEWENARAFLNLHPAALKRIIFRGGTVLHAAVQAEQDCRVEELVNMILEHDSSTEVVAMRDSDGNTALHLAIITGNQWMTERLITNNMSLLSVRARAGFLPVTLAMSIGHKELARYLYLQTPTIEDLKANDCRDGARLLTYCICNRDLDMALDLLVHCPRAASGLAALRVLAVSTEEFESENRLVFWKRWIYNHCIHNISLVRAADEFRVNFPNFQEMTIGTGRAYQLWSQLVSNLSNFFGFKRLCEMKLVRAQFQELLSLMCEAIPANQDITGILIKLAISRGNFEFVCQILKSNSSLMSIGDLEEKRHMFHWAVVHRQHRIFSLIYHLKMKNFIISLVDRSRNNMLHLAAMLPKCSSKKCSPNDDGGDAALQMQRRQMQRRDAALQMQRGDAEGVAAWQMQREVVALQMQALQMQREVAALRMQREVQWFKVSSPIDQIRGPALQMQREVQWFKELQSICPRSDMEYVNEDGLTPNQLFTIEHEDLRKEGEEWMKGTATSCTVVGALIITIMFTAAFTAPGGNNQDTGLPIFVHDKLFKLFIVADSLSLFASTTSVLMFLGILTSRYAEEDFLRSLPRKMIIGLFALFFSIATMMIAFSAALFLMLRGKYWVIVPIIGLAGIPIILFVLMQSRLLIDMLVSTYGSGIFDKKKKSLF